MKARWVTINGEAGPPSVSLDNGTDLVFESWAEMRELAMTLRGALTAHYGIVDECSKCGVGRIAKRVVGTKSTK